MLPARTWVLTKACWCECNLGSLLGLIVFCVKGLMFCAKCHLYVLGMMDELVVLITKNKLLHLGFEAIITCVGLSKNSNIVTMGWVQ